jgi:hypothetical protein
MTANLLAHSDGLFAAGIARSGAYNRTLTPFGFQSERRSFWDARDVYVNLSPFTYANQIKEPILLIHGQADNNPGTYTVQIERFYQALQANGATARSSFAARIARLPRPRIRPARPGRDVRVGRQVRQEQRKQRIAEDDVNDPRCHRRQASLLSHFPTSTASVRRRRTCRATRRIQRVGG